MVTLHAFLLISVDIYKQSFTSESTVLVRLEEAHIANKDRTIKFQKRMTNEDVMSQESVVVL